MGVPVQDLSSQFTSAKIHHGSQLPPFRNQSKDDKCANIEPVCTKFDRETRSQNLKHARSAKQTTQAIDSLVKPQM